MKNIYTAILLLTMMSIVSAGASAQARLGLYTGSVSSTTPNINDQLSVFTTLRNVSTTDTFRGPIDFILANKDSIITNINVVGKPAFTGTVITLAPGESKSALFTVRLLPTYFSVGPDIIIVWPIAGVLTVDSAKAPITINPALGVTTISNDEIKVINNDGHLVISQTSPGISLRQVQIFGLNGDRVKLLSPHTATIDISLSDIAAGLYIVEITDSKGETKRLKFVN